MQLSALQKSAAQAIVNIFETGSIRGDYADVTLLPGDSGQLTYGRSQTTLASGNLFLLIQDYCGQNDGSLSAALKPYLSKLQACDSSLNNDMTFRSLLKDAGSDPVMQEVQDAFFDRVYWDPAMRSADALGAQSALGAAIVYDSTVHGSWAQVRDMTRKQFGELKQIGEVQWMSDYVETRRQWLATYPNPLLHKTVYRMDAFRQIINAGNWKLGLPLVVRGLSITPDSLSDAHPVNVAAEGAPRRQLRLATPAMTGPDVSWLQQRLTLAGIHIAETGTFDADTDTAVKAFQTAHDLKADGIVGPVTRSALEDVPLVTPAKSLTPAAAEPMPAVVVPKPAPATPPAAVQPAVSAPAATGESAADIKQHVTAQVKTGVAAVQKTIVDTHQQMVSLVAPAVKAPAQKKAPLATAQEVTTVLSTVNLSGRPILAAAGSLLILLFAEIRDGIAWVTAGLSKDLAYVHVPPFPALPQSPQDAQRFFAESYVYLHALLASIPNAWMFRIRIVAMLLIVYALYRLRKTHVSLGNIQQRVSQVQGDISTAKQDFAEAQQVAQDVEQVVQTVK
ncbi:MAG TPA: peptidoglycan-binding protein [Rhizomicrobium sp.]|nr:peptidoglycan-binding protein [Rhizomicrobium sp.]